MREREIQTQEQSGNSQTWIPADEELWRNAVGPYLTREQVQQQLRISTPEEVDALVQEGKLLELPTSEGPAYPTFQFTKSGKLHPTISRVIGVLHVTGDTPYMTASWIKGAKPDLLDRQTPLQWLEGRRSRKAVIDAARSTARRLSR